MYIKIRNNETVKEQYINYVNAIVADNKDNIVYRFIMSILNNIDLKKIVDIYNENNTFEFVYLEYEDGFLQNLEKIDEIKLQMNFIYHVNGFKLSLIKYDQANEAGIHENLRLTIEPIATSSISKNYYVNWQNEEVISYSFSNNIKYSYVIYETGLFISRRSKKNLFYPLVLKDILLYTTDFIISLMSKVLVELNPIADSFIHLEGTEIGYLNIKVYDFISSGKCEDNSAVLKNIFNFDYKDSINSISFINAYLLSMAAQYNNDEKILEFDDFADFSFSEYEIGSKDLGSKNQLLFLIFNYIIRMKTNSCNSRFDEAIQKYVYYKLKSRKKVEYEKFGQDNWDELEQESFGLAQNFILKKYKKVKFDNSDFWENIYLPYEFNKINDIHDFVSQKYLVRSYSSYLSDYYVKKCVFYDVTINEKNFCLILEHCRRKNKDQIRIVKILSENNDGRTRFIWDDDFYGCANYGNTEEEQIIEKVITKINLLLINNM